MKSRIARRHRDVTPLGNKNPIPAITSGIAPSVNAIAAMGGNQKNQIRG
ncbi:MAG: hypothetical protein KJ064_22020 [Anaerolineae bacterium]|nr:hypothetical protein [Anaerolineae bacterium]